jgi:hypothetical protein
VLFLYRLWLFLLFFGFSSLPIYTMDMSNHCDFKIINGYGKELRCRLTFEYKDESVSCGESEIIILEDGQERHILLSRLKILDSDTQSIIHIEKLNVAPILFEAWVPGHELPASHLYEPKESQKQNQKQSTDETSAASESTIVSSVWNKISNGIMYITGRSEQPNIPSLQPDDEEDSDEAKVDEPLEGCAALITPQYINLLKIKKDHCFNKPMITVSNGLSF